VTEPTTEEGHDGPVLQTRLRATDATRDKGEVTMTLGDRCDEIVRLIDDTLGSVGTDSASGVDTSSHPSGGALPRRRRPLELVVDRRPPARPDPAA
jgi:hypothetical protein